MYAAILVEPAALTMRATLTVWKIHARVCAPLYMPNKPPSKGGVSPQSPVNILLRTKEDSRTPGCRGDCTKKREQTGDRCQHTL